MGATLDEKGYEVSDWLPIESSVSVVDDTGHGVGRFVCVPHGQSFGNHRDMLLLVLLLLIGVGARSSTVRTNWAPLRVVHVLYGFRSPAVHLEDSNGYHDLG